MRFLEDNSSKTLQLPAEEAAPAGTVCMHVIFLLENTGNFQSSIPLRASL